MHIVYSMLYISCYISHTKSCFVHVHQHAPPGIYNNVFHKPWLRGRPQPQIYPSASRDNEKGRERCDFWWFWLLFICFMTTNLANIILSVWVASIIFSSINYVISLVSMKTQCQSQSQKSKLLYCALCIFTYISAWNTIKCNKHKRV